MSADNPVSSNDKPDVIPRPRPDNADLSDEDLVDELEKIWKGQFFDKLGRAQRGEQ